MPTIRTAFAFLFVFAATLFAQTNPNPTVAFAYVGSTTSPGKISAFSIQQNGFVHTVSGSPFSGPSQQLALSSGFLWGTDGTHIATFTRRSNGSLFESSVINGTAHNDTPQGSGVGAMTLDRSGSSLYASETNFQGADNDAYAEFGIPPATGRLEFRVNSPINVDYNSLLSFSENNEFAYGHGCFFANWDLFAFHRQSGGTLTAFDPGNTFPPNPSGDLLCPSGMGASARGFLAVTYSVANAGSKHNVITYRITSTGGLQEITNSVVPTNFTGISAAWFDPTGNFLAIAGQNGIETFRLNSNGTLTRFGNVVEPGVNFRDLRWDKAGHVYAISNTALYVFTLHSTGLALTGAPHAIANAGWLAVLPL